MQQGRACYTPSCFLITKELTANENGEFSTTEFQAPGTWLAAAVPPSTLDSPHSPTKEPVAWAETFYPGVPQAAHSRNTGL